ncbi:CRISPR-associated protein, Cas2 family [Chlorobium phaeobacteroides DSM 266]|uniref:CRISPR-associated endoribonuclease Cas2 n=2 Tax=Chlorobium phaeobacteroides TaxID=1096 RepID=A1BI45_CHLPD|nr:CRISPR-associated protein, Cas2 family [Chlorobium phaeobacteroides DSM 266]
MLVSYDICDIKRLPRVAKLMEGYGVRVQYSVFECSLTQRQLMELQRRLKRLIKPEVDSVRFYPLCESCRDEIVILGQGTVSRDEPYYIA